MVYDLDNKTTKLKIGERIREERLAAGLSQPSFALAVGLKEDSRQSVIKWENGYCLPPFNRLLEMCKVFACEIGYLLCEPGFECKTRKETDFQEATGLSKKAIEQLIATKYIEPEYKGGVSSNLISLILENDVFWFKLDELLPIYIADKYEHNAPVLEVGMIRYTLNSIFEDLINEICGYICKTSPLKPLPRIEPPIIIKKTLREQG